MTYDHSVDGAGDRANVRVLALCGGIGGAKLALGLYKTLLPGQLTVAINTGDDFDHLGLHVSPDIDTVTYTLAGLSDTDRGWGLARETWGFMSALERLGGEKWFMLGDRDLATHVQRTFRMNAGESLSTVTADFAAHLDIKATLLPMSDDPVQTMIETAEGELSFQQYFVGQQCRPVVRNIRFSGASTARIQPQLQAMLADPSLTTIVICPSNPYLSIDPMLALPGLKSALAAAHAPVIAVSPIVGGRAVKGPTAKIMEELGVPNNIHSIARHYRGLIDGLIVDDADAVDAKSLTVPAAVTSTIMASIDDRVRLARTVMNFSGSLQSQFRSWRASQ